MLQAHAAGTGHARFPFAHAQGTPLPFITTIVAEHSSQTKLASDGPLRLPGAWPLAERTHLITGSQDRPGLAEAWPG